MKWYKAIAELTYDFDFNSLVGSNEVTLKPASHALSVSYASGSINILEVGASNIFDEDSDNGLYNIFNTDIEWSMSGTVSFRRKFGLQTAYKRTV